MGPSSYHQLKEAEPVIRSTKIQIKSASPKPIRPGRSGIRTGSLIKLCFVLGTLVAIVSPMAVTTLLLAYFAVAFLLTTLQSSLKSFSSSVEPSDSSLDRSLQLEPFVSVFLPISNESPAKVIATLNSLNSLNYRNFEVLVLDSNTSDREPLWEVYDYCRSRENFQFYQIPKIKDTRVGALNYCLAFANKSSRYCAILSAGQMVKSHFLIESVSALNQQGLDFVQFPQSYLEDDHSGALKADCSEYFDCVLPASNDSHSPLLTGELSVISVSALRELGGWKNESLNEDTELAMRLFLNGYAGRFINKKVSEVALPRDSRDLISQRMRQLYGNAQNLFQMSIKDWKRLGLEGSVSSIFQLTSMFQYLALPLLVLCGAVVFHALGLIENRVLSQIAVIVSLGAFGVISLNAFSFIYHLVPGYGLKRAGAAFLLRQGLFLETNGLWLQALFAADKRGGTGAISYENQTFDRDLLRLLSLVTVVALSNYLLINLLVLPGLVLLSLTFFFGFVMFYSTGVYSESEPKVVAVESARGLDEDHSGPHWAAS